MGRKSMRNPQLLEKLLALLLASFAVDTAVALAPDAPMPIEAPESGGRRRPVEFFGKPLLLGAHRGGLRLWPEETLEGFKRAVARWPDVLLEGDARLSKDGRVVLFHDATVDRTTNGTGAVRDMTLAELSALDAGYWFTPDDGATFPFRGKGVKPATLAEALAAFPESRFLIELKPQIGVAEAAVRVIQEAHAGRRVALASFSAVLMEQACRQGPHIIRCYDIAQGMRLVEALHGGRWDAYEPAADILAIDEAMIRGFGISPADFRAIRKKGIAISVHTINHPARMRKFLDIGVDIILTDWPDRLAHEIETWKAAGRSMAYTGIP